MKIINYTDLDDLKDMAREYGLDKDLTETSMSYSFRIFRGRTCTELHILHIANIKDKKPEPVPQKITASAGLSFPGPGFNYNDGGRAAAGFKGNAGDCVCRSICIVTGRPYKEVYAVLSNGNAMQRKSKRSNNSGKRTAANGISTSRKWFADYMTSLGFKWVPTMSIGSGCKVHLKASELPPGKIIVRLSRHFTSVIDGIINDTYDCSRGGSRCVYGYYKLINQS